MPQRSETDPNWIDASTILALGTKYRVLIDGQRIEQVGAINFVTGQVEVLDELNPRTPGKETFNTIVLEGPFRLEPADG